MKRFCGIVTLSAAVALGGCAGAQYENGSAAGMHDKQPMASAPTSTADREFVFDAAAGGAYEVQAGRLALQKSNDPTVRDIAQHMADDHAKANASLVTIARARGIRADNVPTAEQQAMLNHLANLEGPEFDREFLRQQRDAHRETIRKFETAAAHADDSIIRSFASDTLPTLREHLNMITQDTERYGMED